MHLDDEVQNWEVQVHLGDGVQNCVLVQVHLDDEVQNWEMQN